MTTATPLARYGAVEGALASGFATAQLHHLWGRDRRLPSKRLEFCRQCETRRLCGIWLPIFNRGIPPSG